MRSTHIGIVSMRWSLVIFLIEESREMTREQAIAAINKPVRAKVYTSLAKKPPQCDLSTLRRLFTIDRILYGRSSTV